MITPRQWMQTLRGLPQQLLQHLSPRQRQYAMLGALLAGGVGLLWSIFAFTASSPPASSTQPAAGPASSITNIDGALRFRLRVTNPNGTAGGGTEFKRTVTEQDMDLLTQQLRTQLEGGADYEALKQKLEPGEWLAEESITTRILSQGFDQYKDEPAENLNMTLRLGASGSAVDEATLRDLLISQVQTALPERSQLIVNSMTVQRVPGAEGQIDSSVRFTVTVNAEYLVPIDPSQVSAMIAGKSEEEAIQLLQTNWKLAATPEFYRDPTFFGVLPALPSRIQVRVDYGNE